MFSDHSTYFMSILILNKTISFAWLIRIMQIPSVRPKLLRSDNHTRLKRLRPRNQRHESRTMRHLEVTLNSSHEQC